MYVFKTFNKFTKNNTKFYFIFIIFISLICQNLCTNYDISLGLSKIYNCNGNSCLAQYSYTLRTSTVSNSVSVFKIVNETSGISTNATQFSYQIDNSYVNFITDSARYCDHPKMTYGTYCSCYVWDDIDNTAKEKFKCLSKHCFYKSIQFTTKCPVIERNRYIAAAQWVYTRDDLVLRITGANYEVLGRIIYDGVSYPFTWNGQDSKQLVISDVTFTLTTMNTPSLDKFIGNYIIVNEKDAQSARLVQADQVNLKNEKDPNKYCFFQTDGTSDPPISDEEYSSYLSGYLVENEKHYLCDSENSRSQLSLNIRNIENVFNDPLTVIPNLRFYSTENPLSNDLASTSSDPYLRAMSKLLSVQDPATLYSSPITVVQNTFFNALTLLNDYYKVIVQADITSNLYRAVFVPSGSTGYGTDRKTGIRYWNGTIDPIPFSAKPNNFLTSFPTVLNDGIQLVDIPLYPLGNSVNDFVIPLNTKTLLEFDREHEVANDIYGQHFHKDGNDFWYFKFESSDFKWFWDSEYVSSFSQYKRHDSRSTSVFYLGDYNITYNYITYVNFSNLMGDIIGYEWTGFNFLKKPNTQLNSAINLQTLASRIKLIDVVYDYDLTIYTVKQIANVKQPCKGLKAYTTCDGGIINGTHYNGLRLFYACDNSAGQIYVRDVHRNFEKVLYGDKVYENTFIPLTQSAIEVCEPNDVVKCFRFPSCNNTFIEELDNFINKFGRFTTDTSFLGILSNIINFIFRWFILFLIILGSLMLISSALWAILGVILTILLSTTFASTSVGIFIISVLTWLYELCKFVGFYWIISLISKMFSIYKMNTQPVTKKEESEIKLPLIVKKNQ